MDRSRESVLSLRDEPRAPVYIFDSTSSQEIEDEDDEYEDETFMSVSLLLGLGVFRILFIFIDYLLSLLERT